MGEKKNELPNNYEALSARLIKPHDLLRSLRLSHDYSQAQLGELINVSRQNIVSMETGKRPIGKNVAKRLAALFEVNYQRFL